MNQFEWSDSGLQLLLNVHKDINDAGGPGPYLDCVLVENSKDITERRSAQNRIRKRNYRITEMKIRRHGKEPKFICHVTHQTFVSMAEAARYLMQPESTVRGWLNGQYANKSTVRRIRRKDFAN